MTVCFVSPFYATYEVSVTRPVLRLMVVTLFFLGWISIMRP